MEFSSVEFSHSTVSDSLQPHESQHARPPCLSPTNHENKWKKKKKLSRGEKNQSITTYTIITQMIDLIGKKIITVIITVIIIYSLSSSNELSEHVC